MMYHGYHDLPDPSNALATDYEEIDPVTGDTSTREPKPPTPPKAIDIHSANRASMLRAIEAHDYFFSTPITEMHDLSTPQGRHRQAVLADVMKIWDRIAQTKKGPAIFKVIREKLQAVDGIEKKVLTKEMFEEVIGMAIRDEGVSIRADDLGVFKGLDSWSEAVERQGE